MAAQAKTKITLTGNQETLLVTLYAKYYDNVSAAKPILGDKWASHVVDQVDYDFSKLWMDASACAQVSLRSRVFDEWTAEFLQVHKDDARGVTVLHMACGLDARSLRLNNKYEANRNIRWIDVDVPEVVDLRRKLLPDPIGGDYTLIGINVVDQTWLEQVPNDRPTVVVFEGLVMYLSEEEGKDLLRRVVERFPEGHLLFDCIASFTITFQSLMIPIRRTGAKLKWGIDDPKALESVHERLRLKDDILACEQPGMDELPWPVRWALYGIRYLPVLRYIGRNVRFEF